MATYGSLGSAAKSVVRLLNAAFGEDQPLTSSASTAALVATSDFDPENGGNRPTTGVSVFPFRVDLNRVMRPAWSAVGHRDGRGHLPLDLHLLLTPWASTPEDELVILGKVMETLEAVPILSGPLLEASGEWEPNEGVQLVLGDITTEEIMRTFDSLPGDYRLSVIYVARVVRIDTPQRPPEDVATMLAGLSPSVPL